MRPITRNTDPITSHIAADQFTKSGKRQNHKDIIFKAICDNPGKTAGELGQITGLGQVRVTRRLSEMDVLIYPGQNRVCTVNKSLMRTWFGVPF